MALLDNNTSKRKRPDDSPEDLSKSVDVCRHCNKKCTKRSEAVQCDLCYSWLHASCEGLNKDQYKLLTQLTSTVDNVMYYCKFNKCETRSRQLMFNSIHKALFPSENSEANKTEPLVLEHRAIRKEISDLSMKVNALCSMNENLHQVIKSTASSIAQSSVPVTQSTSAALSVIDEISDRNRRKNNLIMYNYPEGADLSADKESFTSLCLSLFNLNVEVDKVLRLGRRLEGKHRPLLIRLNSEGDKHAILSQAPHLRFNDQYKRVFISHDMTQSERVKHKALVQELQSRRAKGERNLMI